MSRLSVTIIGAGVVGLWHARELARRGLPATIFVAPGMLNDRSFWWDRYGGAAGSGLSDAERDRALHEALLQKGELPVTVLRTLVLTRPGKSL